MMKVNGKNLDKPRIVSVYLPIANGEAVEFKFRPLRSDEDFEKVLTRPEPKTVMKPGGQTFKLLDDPGYKKGLDSWATQKLDWEFLTCISATDGLEWSNVNLSEPETWKNWRTDLLSIFNNAEVNRLFQAFMEAQYITEDMMEKARACFLTGTLEQADKPQSQTDAQ